MPGLIRYRHDVLKTLPSFRKAFFAYSESLKVDRGTGSSPV